jgi:hypothetical protein
MEKETIIVWFSCGAASAVAAKKTIELYGQTHEIVIVNNPVKEEDEDNRRFLKDISDWLDKPIFEFGSKEFPSNSAVDVWTKRKFMVHRKGAPCTKFLKKQARYEFELWYDSTPEFGKINWHVLGFTAEEKNRHERFIKTERENTLPVLIDLGITKEMCFQIIQDAGIELPRIYKLGYPNANCIGCVKATSPTYWNHVRKVHPEVFEARAKQSREISKKGAKLVRHKGKRIHLDELPPDAKGRPMKTLKMPECGIFCDTK